MSRIIVYGASGFVGSHIYNALLLYGDVVGVAFNHPKEHLAYSDVTKYKNVEEDLLGCQPDFVIFSAGNKNRDVPYKDLYRDNVMPIKHLYKVIKKHKLKTKVIFISTDSVFDGCNGRNYPSLIPQPVSNYGKTKYLAEQALEPVALHFGMKSPVDYRIIRTSAVIGKGSLFLSWLKEKFLTCDNFKVFDNQYLSPTSIELLTNSILYLMENWDKEQNPIIHICGKRMSRYKFACLVRDACFPGSPVSKDTAKDYCDTSLIPSSMQKKIIHKPMEEYLKEIC